MEIFAATSTNAPPGAKHSRDPLLLAVTELLPFVTLPRTYSPKNRLDLPGADPIHRPLRSRITSYVCSLGKGSPLRSLSSRSRSWLQRPLTSSMYRIRAEFVEEFALADEEWDCQLVSTSTVAVRKQVARIGHRLATTTHLHRGLVAEGQTLLHPTLCLLDPALSTGVHGYLLCSTGSRKS